jgi:hypothetical protein
MSDEIYVLNMDQCQNRSPSRADFLSMSGCRPCLSFPCGPKNLCFLFEVAAIFDGLMRPRR